jgi:YbbR domain-containing protein
VNWVTENWRLKVLALGLSVLMLGAVAFAQNPPTFQTLTVPILYTGTVPNGLVLINPPTKTSVRVTGLADTIASVSASSVTAAFDLAKAKVGPRVNVNLIVKSLVQGVQVQNPTVPLALDIDRRVSVKLTVVARYPREAPGWHVTKSEARCPNAPCVVTFTGPQTWETDPQTGKANLNAYTDFPIPAANPSTDVYTQNIVLVQNGSLLDLTTFTVPTTTVDPPNVAIHIDAVTSTSSRQAVLMVSAPSHAPPSGYQVTGITLDPILVVISGPPDVLSKIQSLALPAVDLSGHTSDSTFRITIPYPAGVTGSVQTARVTYSISRNPNVQPSPTPT